MLSLRCAVGCTMFPWTFKGDCVLELLPGANPMSVLLAYPKLADEGCYQHRCAGNSMAPELGMPGPRSGLKMWRVSLPVKEHRVFGLLQSQLHRCWKALGPVTEMQVPAASMKSTGLKYQGLPSEGWRSRKMVETIQELSARGAMGFGVWIFGLRHAATCFF